MVMDSNEQIDVELRRKDEEIRLRFLDIQNLHGRIDKLTRAKRKAEFDLEEVYASYSWRAAGILRAIRYVFWTIPILIFQWGQRIFLDKGLINRASLKADRNKTEPRNLARSNQVQQKKRQNIGKRLRKNNIHRHQNLPELHKNLLLTYFETKYVVGPDSTSDVWNHESLQRSRQTGIVDYDLRNPGVFRRQAKLALEMGVDGFCYRYDESSTMILMGPS
jgi:hypothetical protein